MENDANVNGGHRKAADEIGEAIDRMLNDVGQLRSAIEIKQRLIYVAMAEGTNARLALSAAVDEINRLNRIIESKDAVLRKMKDRIDIALQE